MSILRVKNGSVHSAGHFKTRVSVELLEKEPFDIKYLKFLICGLISDIDKCKVFVNKFE